VLFGYVAAAAPKLELVTAVVILPQRQTALVAKQAAEIDVLSGGKLRLGVGIGWNWVEYEGLGMNFKNRARRFEEQIELLRRYWQEPTFTHQGRYEQVTAAGINPLPIQRPIPIWIGGSAEPALKRAAEIADGFFPQRPLEGGWPATLERMRAWREAAGKDWGSYGIEARINAGTGTPDDWRAAYAEWKALGATHITVNTMNGGLRGPAEHIQRIREVKAALG
jgi:probable F420-dependent oxidoreductase